MIPAKLQSILDDLAFFPDRAERIEALIAMSEEYKHPSKEEFPRDPSCRVPGCESEVFIGSTPSANGGLKFQIAVDNPQGISAMAMATILKTGLEDVPVEQIQEVPEDLVYDIFGRELSMGKSLGLMGMVKMVKHEAAKPRDSR